MAFDQNMSDKNKATTIAAGTTTAVAAITSIAQICAIIYEKITGNTYSKADRERLEELKKCYQQAFQTNPPIYWELDEKNRPTHSIESRKWLPYVRELKQNKGIGHYHYQSNMIAEHAVTYLVARGQRWIGGGKPGDIVEQFFWEWIRFAFDELPTFGYDTLSINKIKARLQYLEKIQKHENMFKHDTFPRGKNKSIVIESIKKQLKSCIVMAEQESLRQSAREQFDQYRNHLTALLLSSIQMIYYARLTDTSHEPLELESYINLPDASPISEPEKTLYDSLKETHTGAMLSEIISLATPGAFGCSEQQAPFSKTLIYYTLSGEKTPVDWQTSKNDLPKWVEAQEAERCLLEVQAMGESILRMAQLKVLIEIAYDLTGKVGDLWAYGDKRGKLSMQALLFLLREESQILKVKYDQFYAFHNKRRHEYNLQNHINPDKGSNPNFNKVDDHYAYMTDRYQSLCTVIHTLHDQLSQYPEDLEKEIDQKKEKFYHSISMYIKKYYPDTYPQYQFLDPDRTNEQLEKNRGQMTQVSQPTLHTSKKTNAHQVNKKISIWHIWSNDQNWSELFSKRHRITFELLWNTKKEMLSESDDPDGIDRSIDLAKKIKKIISQLKNNIAIERPRWKIKLQPTLLITFGWPFNISANKSANNLLEALDKTLSDVENFIAISKIKLCEHERNTVDATSTVSIMESLATQSANSQPDSDKPTAPVSAKNVFMFIKKTTGASKNMADWFMDIYSQIVEWEEKKSPVCVFKKEDEPEQLLSIIIDFLDQSDKKDNILRLWDTYIVLVELGMASPLRLDNNTSAQFALLLTLNDIIQSATEKRKCLEESFVDQFNTTFSRRENCVRLNDLPFNVTSPTLPNCPH